MKIFAKDLAKFLEMGYNEEKFTSERGPMKKDLIYRLFSHIPTLETDRLILRGMRVSDAADMYEYARRPSVTEYLTWEPHASVEQTREYLVYVGQRYRTGDFYDWSVICKEDVIITNAQAVEKSYPKFFEHFNKLGGKADVIKHG